MIYRPILVVAGSCLTVALANAAVHVGENGIAYSSDNHAVSGPAKISTQVREAARTADSVDVIIYLARYAPREDTVDPVRSVKAVHMAEIERLGTEIRDTYSRYRPMYPMDEAEEKAYQRAIAGTPLPNHDHERVTDLKRQLDARRTVMHKAVSAVLVAAGAAERTEMIDAVHAAGGKVTAEVSLTNAIGATIPAAMIDLLAHDKRVLDVQFNAAVDYELNISAISIGWQFWHASDLDGSGIFDVGVVDTGVQQSHPNLTPAEGFYTHSATGTDPDQAFGHGTHVTGILASKAPNPLYTMDGGVPNVGAIIWEHADDQATTMSRMHNLASDFPQSPESVNHGLGYGTANDVDYNSNDSFYDAYIDNFQIMVSKSAGNGGWTTSDPGNPNITITHPASAYNLLAVVNMDDNRTSFTKLDDKRNESSSVGPTTGGRRKPDIGAPGTAISSINFNGSFGGPQHDPCNGPAAPGTDNPNAFCVLSGTSMAAAHVAASVVLLEDGGNFTPLSQKAVLLNSADPWSSNDTSTSSDDFFNPLPDCPGGLDPCDTGWDKAYGWGYIDMQEAFFNNPDFFIDSIVPRNDTAVDDDYKLYAGHLFLWERATMTWFKRADVYNDGAAAGGRRNLSDLNMRLYADADGDLIDADFSEFDNVQQVVSSETGQKVIKVYSWSTVFDGASSEAYALATEEGFMQVNPPTFSSTPLIPVVGPFQTFVAPTQTTNDSAIGAHSTTVSIANIGGVSGDGTSQSVGTIAGGDTTQVDFTLTTVGLGAGTYSIPVTVSSDSYDETYTQTFPTGVQFSVETTPPTSSCSVPTTATNNTLISISWTASDGITSTGVDQARLYVATPGAGAFNWAGLAQNGTNGAFNYNMVVGDGEYRFAIRALDNGGNWEAVPVATECLTFLDTVDPASTVSSPVFDASGIIPLTFSVTDAAPSSGLEIVDFWYYAEPAGPWTWTRLSANVQNGVANWFPPGPGVYHLVSRAKDNAQNIEPDTFVPPPADSVTNYGSVDSDGDGLLDLADNCQFVPNADQRDTNGDLIGNACDPDINNDCFVNFLDLDIYKANFFQPGNLDTDNNGDGTTNFVDLGVIQDFFFSPPGPGALGACN